MEALTHCSWKKKSNLTLHAILPICQITNHLSQMHSGASSGEMTHHPFLVKEKQSPDSVLIVPALSNDETQRPPCTVPRLGDSPDFTFFLCK